MGRRKKKNMIDTAAGESVRAFADVGTAVAKLRNAIPDRALVDSIAKDGSTRGDGLVALNEILDRLAACGRVYAHHDDTMLVNAKNTKFRLLSVDGRAERQAGTCLWNVIAGVQYKVNDRTGEIEGWEFELPDAICRQLFAMDACMSRLPPVTTYATHSVFDSNFRLCGPGYHPDQQILVQGLDIVPMLPGATPPPRTMARSINEAIDRLPPHLRRLLKDFDWAGVVDLTNAVGALLMGLLMNHFVEDGHPAVFIRGNQPSIGKSLLAKVIGMTFDGRSVPPIKKSGDEEFDKLLCAMLKKRRRMVFLDNLRERVDSERIEQIITSPTLMIRMLGTNEFGEWPNDVLFVLTSNNLVAGRDLVSRNLVIDLYTEGDPKKRQEARKASKPVAYAREHRAEILGELADMTLRWVEEGCSEGELNTRFERVSQVVGGILAVNGFPGFASNADAAAVEMDDDLQRMLELVEEIVAGKHGAKAVVHAGDDASAAGLVASEWVPAFKRLGLIDVGHQREVTAHSQTVMVGKALSRHIDTTFTVEVGARQWAATMRRRGGGGNKQFYYAEVATLSVDSASPEAAPAPTPAPAPTREESAVVDATPASAPPAGRPRPASGSHRPAARKGWVDAAATIARQNPAAATATATTVE